MLYRSQILGINPLKELKNGHSKLLRSKAVYLEHMNAKTTNQTSKAIIISSRSRIKGVGNFAGLPDMV